MFEHTCYSSATVWPVRVLATSPAYRNAHASSHDVRQPVAKHALTYATRRIHPVTFGQCQNLARPERRRRHRQCIDVQGWKSVRRRHVGLTTACSPQRATWHGSTACNSRPSIARPRTHAHAPARTRTHVHASAGTHRPTHSHARSLARSRACARTLECTFACWRVDSDTICHGGRYTWCRFNVDAASITASRRRGNLGASEARGRTWQRGTVTRGAQRYSDTWQRRERGGNNSASLSAATAIMCVMLTLFTTGGGG